MAMHDDLSDFTERTWEHDDTEYAVYVTGTGPAVLVLPEMPGIAPHLLKVVLPLITPQPASRPAGR